MISLLAKRSIGKWIRFNSSKSLGAVTELQRDIGRKVAYRQMEAEKKFDQDEHLENNGHTRKLHRKDEVKAHMAQEKKGTTNDINDDTLGTTNRVTSNTKRRDTKANDTGRSSATADKHMSTSSMGHKMGVAAKSGTRVMTRKMSTATKSKIGGTKSSAQDKSATISHSKKDGATSSAHHSGVASNPSQRATEGAQKTKDSARSAANVAPKAATRAAHEAGVKTKWEEAGHSKPKK